MLLNLKLYGAFLLSLVLVLVVPMSTTLVQSLRASRQNPVKSLSYE